MTKDKRTCKKKASGQGILYTILVLFAVFCAISLYFSSDPVSACINLIVLAAMLAFLLAGTGRIFYHTGTAQLDDCTADFDKITAHLKELDESQPGTAWESFQAETEWEFSSPLLKDAVLQFNQEAAALSMDSTFPCDVEDYINEELLSEIGNIPFNDFVSNVMTGLGILGTFVGLAFGLRSFDVSTAEAMTNSIVPLIDGIKVAFLTSIFGVIFSLVYGTAYRHCLKNAQQALNHFLDVYYKCMGRRPANDVASRILNYQQSQTECMNQFAENISIALSDALNNTLSPALNALPDQISQSMHEQISPALDIMETNLTQLSGELSTQLSHAQEQGVETLIQNFMSGMDKLMDGQIEHLSQSIQTICTWQETTIQRLDETVSGICKNTDGLNKINEDLRQTTQHLDTFIAELKQFQEDNHKTMLETAASFTSSVECVEQAGSALIEVTEQSSEITGTIREAMVGINKQEQLLRKATAEQMESITKQAQVLKKLLSEQAEALTQQGTALQESLRQAVTAQTESITRQEKILGDAVDAHARTIQSATDKQLNTLQEGTKLLTAQNNEIKNSGTHLTAEFKRTSSEMITTIESLDSQLDAALSRSFAQFDTQLANALQHFSGTLTELQDVVEGAPQMVDDVAARLQKETASCLHAMQESQTAFAKSMNTAFKEISAQLRENLPRTNPSSAEK